MALIVAELPSAPRSSSAIARARPAAAAPQPDISAAMSSLEHVGLREAGAGDELARYR
jgi:hypothetical protein